MADLFEDAELLSYPVSNQVNESISLTNPSSFKNMMKNDVVFNDLETKVYYKIVAIVAENKKLKTVLQRNNERLEDHYNKCIELKEKYNEKETNLKRELLEEQNKYKDLECIFESYKKTISLNNFSLVSIQPEIQNVIENEKGNIVEMLQRIGDKKPENNVLEAAKESLDVLQGFSDSSSSDFKNFADLESQLTSIKGSLTDNESFYSSQVKDLLSNAIKSIQLSKETPSTHCNTQQISIEQYIELNARYDASVKENRLLKLEYEKLNESHAKLLKISEQFEILRNEHLGILAELKEKDEKLVSLKSQMDNRSVIIEPLNGKEIDELKAENERLILMNNELKLECAETMNTFTAVDEENTLLKEQNKAYSKESIEMLMKYQQVCKENAELRKANAFVKDIPYENVTIQNNQLQPSIQEDNPIKTRLAELEMLYKELKYKLEEKTDELAVVKRESESQRNKLIAELKQCNQAYQSQLQGMTITNEKLKKEAENLWKNLQFKAQQLKEKDHMENVIREKDDQICTLKVKVDNLTEQMQIMTIELESIPLYQTQMVAYENDFKAERAAREKKHQEFLQVNQQLDELIIENMRLKEEINNLSCRPLLDLQRRFVSPSTMGRYDGSNIQYPYNDKSDQFGSRSNAHLPEQNHFIEENNFWSRRPADVASNARVPYHSEERKCPKCQDGFPDLDSLQLHVVECLDN